MKKQTAIELGVMRGLTDVIYFNLFKMTTWELLQHFKLSINHLFDDQDDALRDRMGIHALQALMEIEDVLTKRFRSIETMPDDWTTITGQIAKEIGAKYKALATEQGVDFLTGEAS